MRVQKVNLLGFWVLPVGLWLNGKLYLKPEFGSCKFLNQVGLPKGKSVYNPTRLEWHLGDELSLEPRRFLCGLDRQQASLLTQFNRLAVVLAKNQDHRASCGVFVFGLPNAVRRWLGKRYPVTRANQSGESGLRIELGGRDKSLAYAPQIL